MECFSTDMVSEEEGQSFGPEWRSWAEVLSARLANYLKQVGRRDEEAESLLFFSCQLKPAAVRGCTCSERRPPGRPSVFPSLRPAANEDELGVDKWARQQSGLKLQQIKILTLTFLTLPPSNRPTDEQRGVFFFLFCFFQPPRFFVSRRDLQNSTGRESQLKSSVHQDAFWLSDRISFRTEMFNPVFAPYLQSAFDLFYQKLFHDDVHADSDAGSVSFLSPSTSSHNSGSQNSGSVGVD